MSEVEEALQQVQRILDTIDDEVPEWAQDKAPDFFEGVSERVKGIGTTVEARAEVTANQKRALDNMEAAVRKWIR